jgi:aspartyl protease family protein
MQKILALLLLTGSLLSVTVHADSEVAFVGQFGDKAVLQIDGKRRVLAVGETSREGVELLSVTSDSAVILHRGVKRKLGFSAPGNTAYRQTPGVEVIIWADSRGHFQTPGTINGQLVSFLVDTGATSVAMNEVMANKLGIDFRYSGEPTTVMTASGMVAAHDVKLSSVKIGGIELTNVDGTVVEGGFPTEVLLGMSFLSQVDIERKGNRIRLVKTR